MLRVSEKDRKCWLESWMLKNWDYGVYVVISNIESRISSDATSRLCHLVFPFMDLSISNLGNS